MSDKAQTQRGNRRPGPTNGDHYVDGSGPEAPPTTPDPEFDPAFAHCGSGGFDSPFAGLATPQSGNGQ